jgi:hypothetical protein
LFCLQFPGTQRDYFCVFPAIVFDFRKPYPDEEYAAELSEDNQRGRPQRSLQGI